MSLTYAAAGVNIQAGNDAVARIKKHVQRTHSPHVIADVSSFGSLFDIKAVSEKYTHPMLVQSIDGVGTKVMVAKMMDMYHNIGRDLVGNVVGDILVMGAKPLTFLDYIANDVTEPEKIESIVEGIADECMESGMSLVGGEIAEMPGVYQKGEIDLVGFVTGIVDKSNVVNGKHIVQGDCLLGLPSSGIHTNGFTLARKILFDIGKYGVKSHIPELSCSVGEELLKPHRNYTKPIMRLMKSDMIPKGMAHITGGGFIENIPRILPKGLSIEIRKGSWDIQPIFEVMQQIGDVEEHEMYKTFNMGIGIVLVVSPQHANAICDTMGAKEIGVVVSGGGEVVLK